MHDKGLAWRDEAEEDDTTRVLLREKVWSLDIFPLEGQRTTTPGSNLNTTKRNHGSSCRSSDEKEGVESGVYISASRSCTTVHPPSMRLH